MKIIFFDPALPSVDADVLDNAQYLAPSVTDGVEAVLAEVLARFADHIVAQHLNLAAASQLAEDHERCERHLHYADTWIDFRDELAHVRDDIRRIRRN